ncbi:hypothetical protein Hanom_Chr08g00706581 [Helianthus anomalus]
MCFPLVYFICYVICFLVILCFIFGLSWLGLAIFGPLPSVCVVGLPLIWAFILGSQLSCVARVMLLLKGDVVAAIIIEHHQLSFLPFLPFVLFVSFLPHK